MQTAHLPDNETERLAKLPSLGVLDTLPQKAFDDITALASAICGTPDRPDFAGGPGPSVVQVAGGTGAPQTRREVAFCSHAILQPDEVMVVEDAKPDPRFHDNPLVADDPTFASTRAHPSSPTTASRWALCV